LPYPARPTTHLEAFRSDPELRYQKPAAAAPPFNPGTLAVAQRPLVASGFPGWSTLTGHCTGVVLSRLCVGVPRGRVVVSTVDSDGSQRWRNVDVIDVFKASVMS